MDRHDRQLKVVEWANAAFGATEVSSVPQRGLRLLEESIEAFQACGGNAEVAHKLLAAACGLSADQEELREVKRVLAKPVAELTQRNAAKNAAGFLMTAAELTDAGIEP